MKFFDYLFSCRKLDGILGPTQNGWNMSSNLIYEANIYPDVLDDQYKKLPLLMLSWFFSFVHFYFCINSQYDIFVVNDSFRLISGFMFDSVANIIHVECLPIDLTCFCAMFYYCISGWNLECKETLLICHLFDSTRKLQQFYWKSFRC